MAGPPLSATDLTGLVTVLTQTLTTLNAMLRQLQAGVAILSGLPSYTVATLPTTPAIGTVVFATNARKPGEGAAAGTGMLVVWNSATSTWFTTLGVVVTS